MAGFRNLSLLARTNLAILAILLLFFSLTAYAKYRQQQNFLIEQSVEKARILAAEAVLIREYLSKNLRLGQVPLSEDRYGLIPVVAANRINQEVGVDVGYTIRQISDRYRNPKNAPDPFESAVLKTFYQNPYLKDKYSVVDVEDGTAFRYLQPFRADESCLVCHGKPEDAPDFIRQKFPIESDQAYNYSIGEIIGAVSITIPMNRLEQRFLSSLQADFLYLGGAFIAMALCLGLLHRLLITRPLKSLSRAINKVIHTGRFDQALERGSTGEIGTIIDSFNAMMDEVGQRTQLLEDSEQRFRLLTENARDAIISFLDDGKIIQINRRAMELFGYTSTEALGMDILRLLDPECTEVHQVGLQTYLSQNYERLSGCLTPLKVLCSDGSMMSVELSLSTASMEGPRFYTVILRPMPETRPDD